MKIRNKVIAAFASVALALGIGAITAPAAQALPGSYVIGNAGSLQTYVTFDTGYSTWLQPGWTFGPGVQSVNLFGGQCIVWKKSGTPAGSGDGQVCNNTPWNPYNQSFIKWYVPTGTYIIHRFQ